MFFSMVKPFIDPVTRPKMKFNPKVPIFGVFLEARADINRTKVIEDGIFAPDMVMSEWTDQGCKFEYKHEKYWPALVSMCEERRKQQMEKWRELGGTVGLKEWDVRGGQGVLENGKAEATVDEAKEASA